VVLLLMLLPAVQAQESPLQLVLQMHPPPTVVIPDDSYRHLADKIAEVIASSGVVERREVVVYSFEDTGMIDIEVTGEDVGRYLLHAHPGTGSLNPDRESSGIRAWDGGVLFNELYLSRYSKNELRVTPVYYVPELDKMLWRTFSIGGKRYAVTGYYPEERAVAVAEAADLKLYRTDRPVEHKVWDGASVRLEEYSPPAEDSGSALIGVRTEDGLEVVAFDVPAKLPVEVTPAFESVMGCCRVFVVEAEDEYLRLVFIRKKEGVTLSHGMPAFGYRSVWVNRRVGEHGNSLVFVGDVLRLTGDDFGRIYGTPYYLSFSDNRLKLVKMVQIGVFPDTGSLRGGAFRERVNFSLMGPGRLKLEFLSDMLDDVSGDDGFTQRECRRGYMMAGDDGWFWVDADSSGKLGDAGDYVVYNGLRMLGCGEQAVAMPVMLLNVSPGELVRIRGVWYLVKSAGEDGVELYPVELVRLYRCRECYKIIGGFRVSLAGMSAEGGRISFELELFENGTHLTNLIFEDMSAGDEMLSFRAYTGVRAFVAGAGERYVAVAILDGGPVWVENDAPWNGYDRVVLYGDGESIRMEMRGKRIRVKAGDVVEAGNGYFVEFSGDEVDILRKQSRTIRAGRMLASSDKLWREVLRRDVVFFENVRQETPEVRVMLLKDVTEGMNMVLLGTPLDNGLIRALMGSNTSKVDWRLSRGDVEVVKLQNHTVVIVGGASRDDVVNAVMSFLAGAGVSEAKGELRVKISVMQQGGSGNNLSREMREEKGSAGLVRRMAEMLAMFFDVLLGGGR